MTKIDDSTRPTPVGATLRADELRAPLGEIVATQRRAISAAHQHGPIERIGRTYRSPCGMLHKDRTIKTLIERGLLVLNKRTNAVTAHLTERGDWYARTLNTDAAGTP